jgi:hypothetical protein
MLAGPARLDQLVLHNGLLLQWPLFALAGLGVARLRHDDAFATLRTGVLAGSLFALLMLLVGIAEPSGFGAQSGAGLHWGPRVLLPALPAFVALAAAGVRGRPPLARAAWGALALAGLASSALSLGFLAEQERDAARFAEALRGAGARVIVTPHPMLGQHLSPLWQERPMLLANDMPALQAAAEAIAQAREPGFLFVAPAGGRLGSTLEHVACESAFRYRGTRLGYFDLDVERCLFTRDAGG